MSSSVSEGQPTTRHLARGALFVALSSGASSFFALFADALTAARFGAGAAMDAYLTANVIPLVITSAFASTLTASFVPVFHRIKNSASAPLAWRAARGLFVVLGCSLVAVLGICYLMAPHIIATIAPRLAPQTMSATVTMLRFLTLTGLFLGMNSYLSALHNAEYRFTLPAIAPIVQNVFVIVAIIGLGTALGVQSLIVGMTCGAVVMFALMVTRPMRQSRSTGFDISGAGVGETVRNASVLIASGMVYQTFGVVDRYFSSGMPAGTLTCLSYGAKTGMFFSNLVLAGFGSVLLPRFSESVASVDALARRVTDSLCAATVIVVPTVMTLVAARQPLIEVLFQRKAFTPEATLATSRAILFYGGFFIVMGLSSPIMSAFYARRDVVTPFVINCGAVAAYILLCRLFTAQFGIGVVAIPLASSIVHLMNFSVYCIQLGRKVPGIEWGRWLRYLMKSSAVGLAAVAIYFVIVAVTANQFNLTPLSYRISGLAIAAVSWAMAMLALVVTKDQVIRRMTDALGFTR